MEEETEELYESRLRDKIAIAYATSVIGENTQVGASRRLARNAYEFADFMLEARNEF